MGLYQRQSLSETPKFYCGTKETDRQSNKQNYTSGTEKSVPQHAKEDSGPFEGKR